MILFQQRRADLEKLRAFRFTGHPVLSIDPERLERLDSILQFQLDKILA